MCRWKTSKVQKPKKKRGKNISPKVPLNLFCAGHQLLGMVGEGPALRCSLYAQTPPEKTRFSLASCCHLKVTFWLGMEALSGSPSQCWALSDLDLCTLAQSEFICVSYVLLCLEDLVSLVSSISWLSHLILCAWSSCRSLCWIPSTVGESFSGWARYQSTGTAESC